MGIWVKGVENANSQRVNLFYAKPHDDDGFAGHMDPGAFRDVNCLTNDKEEAFGISLKVEGKKRYFFIWAEDNKLHVEVEGNMDYKSVSITRDYGQYKIIIQEMGVCIQDVSVGDKALAHQGDSEDCYYFTLTDQVLQLQSSSDPPTKATSQ